jgi:hypothetical protein
MSGSLSRVRAATYRSPFLDLIPRSYPTRVQRSSLRS